MDKIVIGLIVSVIALFAFFSLPVKYQIRILNTMRSAGSSFSESSSEYIENQGGTPR